MAELCMPSLGADMDAGTIVEWRVQPGDLVRRGDIVAVIDTEKSTIEIEVFADGTIEELLVEPGCEVPVGTPLARIASAPGTGEHPPAEPPPSKASTTAPTTAPSTERAVAADVARPAQPAAYSGNGHPLRSAPTTASPLVRRLAELENIDLATVSGSGAGGAITRHDVERAAAAAVIPAPTTAGGGGPAVARAPRPPAGDRVLASPLARRRARERGLDLHTVAGRGPGGAVLAADLDDAATPPVAAAPAKAPKDRKAALRASLGALMHRSKREIPHYYLSTTIELHEAIDWLTTTNEERSIRERILPAALLLRATVLACRDVPVMNGHWIDGGFHPFDAVHLGVAISLRGGGLVAPSIRDAHELPLEQLMERLRDLVTRARAGTLRASEMTDPSVTVTNLGDQGVETVFGVIYPPQVALVGFGKIVERPWAEHQMLTVRPVLTATLAADHRASDGHDGARFLSAIDHHLQRPEQL